MTWTAALWKVKVPSITKVSCECLKFFGCCIYCIVYCDYIKFPVLKKKKLTAYKTDCDNPSKSIKADESQSIPR